MSWRTLLVLGGIGSGKAEYAASLLPAATGQRRVVPESGGDLAALAQHLAEAKPDEVLLVDDLAGWLPAGGRAGAAAPPAPATEPLVAALAACRARVVLVSSEAGLSTPPSAAQQRRRAEWLGAVNQAIAAAVDAVVLVVAGQPAWLKPAAAPTGTVPGAGAAVPAAEPAVRASVTAARAPAQPVPDLANLSRLPSPDEAAKSAAGERLGALGAWSLGALGEVVRFAAGCQGDPDPAPWDTVRVLTLCGVHRGGVAAGPEQAAARGAALREGTDALAQLAAKVGAGIQVVEAPAAAPIEEGPALTGAEVEQALAQGWQLVEQAADEGVDVLVLASIGDGAEAAAAAVTAVLAPSTEPAGLLARVRTAQGIDDQAWMARCAAVRDAVRRARAASRTTTGRPVLAELGGADLAIGAGVLLAAAARRTPVLLDGPVGAAAGLVARNLSATARHWWLLPDAGGHPLVTKVRETLGLTPLLDLRLELGEGAGALAALPVLRTALSLARTLPRPDVAGGR